MTVRAGAEAFSAHPSGARSGVLLCHGFTGSPASLRPLGEELAAAGHGVELPRLPGHGTRWQDLNQTRWPDWASTLDRALTTLTDRYDEVSAVGLSMGGALALRLAQTRGSALSRLVLVNPAIAQRDARLLALPVLRHVVPSIAGIANDIHRRGADEIAYDRTPLHALASQLGLWRLVREDLPRVTQPLLVFRSRADRVVDATSVRVLRAGVSSEHLTVVDLTRSGHVATLDHDAPDIHARTTAFLSPGGGHGA